MNRLFILFLLFLLPSFQLIAQTTRIKKVVLQGFWWDYKNDNFPNGWANYLTELAPRMKGMGVDAIWIPPTVKNQDFGEKGVGYAPYDHYDLGDKFQKNDATTRVGTKDDLLRMVAVLHANGIEVIQDIVPNHVIGAGSDLGNGGQDPTAPSAGCTDTWKNFRYTCYETPGTDQTATNYFGRKGRFPKNYQNFHPSPDHFCDADLCPSGPGSDEAICWQGFGPDVCYFDGAFGQSSNATYNPDQFTYSPYNNGGIGNIGDNNGYMRKHTREWLVWYKKQMGFDGVRIDAVKHFPNFASEDFLYNLQHNAAWASGDNKMFAVGEWVGSTGELDAWTAAVNNRSGTFDFNLRAFDGTGGLRGMIYGNGGFDLGNLPGAQQSTRYIDFGATRIHRTVPFINNHDTYRPCLNGVGNIIGWKDGSNCDISCRRGDGSCPNDELSQHVDIREPRLGAAYAAMCAMDGNPQIFFEDLFNIANTGKRFSHQPENTLDLPDNSDIANIMLAHGALDFKGGNYKVPSNVGSFYNTITNSNNNDDYLVIERSGKAIIGATDNWNVDQAAWLDTDFPVGTVLQDYSGGISGTTTVQTPEFMGGPNRVFIQTRAVGWPTFTYSTSYTDHGQHYHGYSIWAPAGIDINMYSNAALPTTQEWEMENDLGDSHCESLGQGGRTPDNSPNARVVGKIFAKGSSGVSYTLFLGTPANSLTLEFYDLNGDLLHTDNGSGISVSGSFTNTATRWITMKVRNTSTATAGQKCFVKVTYDAPEVVNTASYPSLTAVSIWTSNGGSDDWNDCRNWEEGLIPTCSGAVLIPHAVQFMPSVPNCFTGLFTNRTGLTLRPKAFLQGPYSGGLMTDALRSGGHLPSVTPYGGSEMLRPAALTVTGANAIVDWVLVQLRDKNAPATVLHTRNALVQSDGDVVGMDGSSPLFFNGVASDDYFVVIRHRNHLGFRTLNPIALAATAASLDFTNASIPLYGTNPLRNNGGVYMMYSGDANHDGQVNAVDLNAYWELQNGLPYSYLGTTADFNLDGAINAVDLNAHWQGNNSFVEQLH